MQSEMMSVAAKCVLLYANFKYAPDTTYCNATHDGYLCWQPTPSGHTAYQHCPANYLNVDPNKYAHRICCADGTWMLRPGTEPTSNKTIGWTNFSSCFTETVRVMINGLNESESKLDVARSTRNMEFVGISFACSALVFALCIFRLFSALRNTRTLIHINLFCAMLGEVSCRLIVYIDQEISRGGADDNANFISGIDNTRYLCEAMYILLEYFITCTFMWFFIEGLHLYNLVTSNALRAPVPYKMTFVCGWGLPALITFAWVCGTASYMSSLPELNSVNGTVVHTCWYGYNFLPIYWVIQGPRFGIVLVNIFFLLRILKNLLGKLNTSQTTDMNKLLKAAKAGLVLLPLLGITNILNMIEPPLNSNIHAFAAWCYITHFLRSFQGVFIAMIYCFFNGEVRAVLSKHWANYKETRRYRRRTGSFRNGQRDPNRSRCYRLWRSRPSDDLHLNEIGPSPRPSPPPPPPAPPPPPPPSPRTPPPNSRMCHVEETPFGATTENEPEYLRLTTVYFTDPEVTMAVPPPEPYLSSQNASRPFMAGNRRPRRPRHTTSRNSALASLCQ